MTTGSKDDDFRELVDRLLSQPESSHALGRCDECEETVQIDTALRPAGMAMSCEEHRPLCIFQTDNSHSVGR